MKLVSGHFEQLECTLEFTLKIKKNSLFLKQLNFIKVPSFSRCTFSTKLSFFKQVVQMRSFKLILKFLQLYFPKPS